jgi:hypothetical protein
MFPRLLACLLLLVTPVALAAPKCQTISGLDQLVLHTRGVMVGDMHGVVEAPAFVKALVCNLLRSNRPVVLGLEYPAGEQHFIDEFLQARSGDPERALLASPFWSRSRQDGRTSRAMLDLLGSVRQELASGARARVVAFDAWVPPSDAQNGTSQAFDARDQAMADFLRRELSTLPGEFPVIFTGNVHARKTQGLPFVGAPPGSENAQPLGYRLKDQGFLHLNIAYRGGAAWGCYQADTCGIYQIGEPGPAVSVFSLRPSANPAYDAEYFVGRLTASSPAATHISKD